MRITGASRPVAQSPDTTSPDTTSHRLFRRMPWGANHRKAIHRIPIGHQLQTDRLCLRALERGDSARISSLADDWEVVKQTASVPYPYRKWHARGWIKGVQQRWQEGSEFAFAIEPKEHGNVIGVVSTAVSEDEKFCPPPNTWEIGYWLGQEYWGKGYAGEAVSAVIDFASTQLKANRLEAQVFVDNRASARLLERRSFAQEGTVSRDLPDRGGERLIYRYGLDFPDPGNLE